MRESRNENEVNFDAEYEEKLGKIFEKFKEDSERIVITKLIRMKHYLNTDVIETSRDIVQNIFLKLLRTKSIDFSMNDEQIRAYIVIGLKHQILDLGRSLVNSYRIPHIKIGLN